MAQLHDILKSKASIQGVEFTEPQKQACYSSMTHYAALKIDEYRASESKSVNLEAIKLFPALLVGDWKLWLRKRSFLKAKKQAQTEADIEGRPFYVIRATQIKYSVQSTEVARELTRRRVYKKGTNSIVLTKTADYTAYPKDRSGFNKVIQDWKNIDRSKLAEDKREVYDKFKPVINSLLKSQFGIKE